MKTIIISAISTILPLLGTPAYVEGYMEYYVPLPTYPSYEPSQPIAPSQPSYTIHRL
jgi:hypothetical protein